MSRWTLFGGVAAAGLIVLLIMQMVEMNGHVEGMNGRWYSEAQVANGGPLYQTNCAGCHGPEAAATPDWRTPNEQGHYPPPPLNGTAHAWHHPLKLLRKTVQDGGIPLGGQMPPFRNQLNDEEIDAILAWIQSHWSDEIYQLWSERNG